MANRLMQQFLFGFNKMLTFIEGNAAIGAVGAVGVIKGSGIKNVVHNGVGDYTIVLEDTYPRYLTSGVSFVNATGSGVAAVEVKDASIQTHIADGTGVRVQCYDFAGLAVDPASGSLMVFWMLVRNSSVKGKGE